MSSALFFKYNTQLGPPYQVLVDTNFINFSIKNKVQQSAVICHGVANNRVASEVSASLRQFHLYTVVIRTLSFDDGRIMADEVAEPCQGVPLHVKPVCWLSSYPSSMLMLKAALWNL